MDFIGLVPSTTISGPIVFMSTTEYSRHCLTSMNFLQLADVIGTEKDAVSRLQQKWNH